VNNLKLKKVKDSKIISFKKALKSVSPEPCDDDTFPKIGLALIFGLDKVGKTSLLLYKIVKNLQNFKRVFYLSGDNTPRDLCEKFNILALNDFLKTELSKKVKFLKFPLYVKSIIEIFKKKHLFVVDPLYALKDFLKLNLNDFKKVANILIHLREAALEKCCAVWISHHTRKSGDAPLGSQALSAVPDLLGLIERMGHRIQITYKARYFIDIEVENFIFRNVGNQKILEFYHDILSPEAEKILIFCEEDNPLSLNMLYNRLPYSRTKIYRVINLELIPHGFLKLKGSGKNGGYILTELGKKMKEKIQKKLEEELENKNNMLKLASEFDDQYINFLEFKKIQ